MASPLIETLAKAQLDAYNRGDLNAFVACYHDDVAVYDEDQLSVSGLEDFRQRYEGLFNGLRFGAEVEQRVVLGSHCIDLEHWWRTSPDDGGIRRGTVLVRYRLKDQRIGLVQFLKP